MKGRGERRGRGEGRRREEGGEKGRKTKKQNLYISAVTPAVITYCVSLVEY